MSNEPTTLTIKEKLHITAESIDYHAIHAAINLTDEPTKENLNKGKYHLKQIIAFTEGLKELTKKL